MPNFDDITGFDWDEGNKFKNWEKHRVDFRECEEVFFNKPLLVSKDEEHLSSEKRYRVLGRSDSNRLLYLVLTIRGDKLRIISARDQTKKEQIKYEQQK